MPNIYFVRHGQSTFNEVYIETPDSIVGKDPWILDAPLSTLGQLQAQELIFKLPLVKNCTIISSPLQRALQTIEPYLKFYSLQAQVNALCTELVENSCDIGSSVQYLCSKYASEHFDFSNLNDKWWYHEAERTVSFEPWEHFEQRVATFVQSLQQLPSDHNAIVISHEMFILQCCKRYNIDYKHVENTQIIVVNV